MKLSHICAVILTGLIATAIAMPALAADPDPYLRPDDTWITINGTVAEVRDNGFTLDYGDGIIIVELEEDERRGDPTEDYELIRGDRVTVNGLIDDDFYETTTIEAGAVYVERLGTQFNASPFDDEDVGGLYTAPLDTSTTDTATTTVIGTVTSIHAKKFTINTEARTLMVEVHRMDDNPLDDAGRPRLAIGDRVRVKGKMDRDVLEQRLLEAQQVTRIK